MHDTENVQFNAKLKQVTDRIADIIRELSFIEDDEVLSKPGVVRTLYDPTAGTGGMLSIAGEYLAEHNPQARLTVFGQELNPDEVN